MEALAAAGADLVAFETIPSIKEAEALMELLREFPNSKAWLSFSCKVNTAADKLLLIHCVSKWRFVHTHCQDGRCISDGSPFTAAVQVANRCSQLVAVGVNCCSPELVEPLLQSAGSLLSPDLSWVVYPNSGEDWNTEQGWVCSQGVSIVTSQLQSLCFH